MGNQVLALDKYNTPKWTFAADGPVWSSAALNPENTLLFIGDDAGVLYCLNPADGAEYARYTTGGNIRATPAMGTANGPEVFVTSGDGHLYCFDQDNLGSYKWRESIGQSAAIELHSSPVIAPNGWVYVGSNDGNLYAFDPGASPRLQWTFATGGRVETAPVIGKNGWVFFGSWDGYVYALDPAAPAVSRLKWHGATGAAVKSTAIMANNDKLYIGSDDRYIYAFNAYGDAGGSLISPDHVSPLLNGPICAGLVAGSDGRVYVGSWSSTSKLYALNANLTLHWEFHSVPGTSLKQVYGAAILGPDGSLYLGDLTGQVFKFPANTLLMGSVWPAFQRDPARSGNGALNPWPRNPNATITELTPYTFGGYSTAYAINNAGVVAGVADGYPNYPNWGYAWNAAFWPIGATTPTMNYPWGWNSSSGVAAYGVNDAGDLVGYNSSQAFVRYANGTGAYLPSVNSGSESARALTFDASYIVGNDGTRAILWSGGGGFYSGNDLGNLGSSFNTAIAAYAYDLNYELRVVGRGRTSTTGPLHAFRTKPGQGITASFPDADMGTLSGNSADTSVAWAISDSGYVAGSSKTTSGQTRAFRFTGSTYTLYPWMDLGTLGGTFSEAKGVNNLGQVVGTARNAANQLRAFLWVTGQGMIDLNTKLPGGSGWVLTSAEAINDDGWIVGVGTKSGVSRAWLMKPQF